MPLAIVYTDTYPITLTATIKQIEEGFGTTVADKFLERLDEIVSKISVDPQLYQALPVDDRHRRAVISRQSSLVYETTPTKIILLYIFDNRQEPFWA
jgi:hypothetical protein